MSGLDGVLVLREEEPEDESRVLEVVRNAFGGPTEAALVTRLRAARPLLSLVGEVDGIVVGHVMFSPAALDTSDARAAQLSPLAVDPGHQRRGVGTALVREGLQRCTELGWTSVFLLGDPRYYSRFGFELASGHGLWHEDPLGEYLQCIELRRGALDGVRGEVTFHEAFAGLA